MAIDSPITQFGFHQMTAISRTDGLPYGTIKVVANYTANSEREALELFGGTNPYPVDTAYGRITADLSLTVKEFKPFLFTLAGYSVTENTAEISGSIAVALANSYGSTVQAVTGIGSVALSTGTTSSADVKDGVYVVKAVSPTTVDVYCVTDINFERGTDTSFVNDSLKITTGALTITASNFTDVPNYGIKLVGGTGTIAMTSGNTATFEVRSTNTGSKIYTYGSNPVPVEFGMYLISGKKSNGAYSYEYYPRVKLAAVPTGMESNAWKEDLTLAVKVMYDNTLGYAKRRDDIIQA